MYLYDGLFLRLDYTNQGINIYWFGFCCAPQARLWRASPPQGAPERPPGGSPAKKSAKFYTRSIA